MAPSLKEEFARNNFLRSLSIYCVMFILFVDLVSDKQGQMQTFIISHERRSISKSEIWNWYSFNQFNGNFHLVLLNSHFYRIFHLSQSLHSPSFLGSSGYPPFFSPTTLGGNIWTHQDIEYYFSQCVQNSIWQSFPIQWNSIRDLMLFWWIWWGPVPTIPEVDVSGPDERRELLKALLIHEAFIINRQHSESWFHFVRGRISCFAKSASVTRLTSGSPTSMSKGDSKKVLLVRQPYSRTLLSKVFKLLLDYFLPKLQMSNL